MCVRHKIHYQVEPGEWIEAYLMHRHGLSGPAPAVVVFHPTNHTTIDEPVGLDTTIPDNRYTALHLAQRGYVTISPRCFLFDYRGVRDGQAYRFNSAATAMKQDHPHWTGMTKMIWDATRAVDYLQSLALVDDARIGCIGLSLGAKQALYAAAFDERITAAVSNEPGLGLAFSNWHDAHYLGPDMAAYAGMDHHDLLGLIAPRAFLLIAGGACDGEASRAYLEAARPVYRLYGADDDGLAFLLHDQGHVCVPAINEQAYAWLDRLLAMFCYAKRDLVC